MPIYEEYQNELGQTFIKRIDDDSVTFIPADEANSDYQRYLRHLAGEDESGTLS